MAIEFEGRVEGLVGLEANIAELISLYGPKNGASTLNLPVRRALEGVRDDIRSSTPVDTGTLQQSVAIRVGQPRADAQGPHVDPNSTIIVGRVGWEWRSPSLSHRALSIEFGTSIIPASPVLVPALMRNSTAMTTIFTKELRANIDRVATRLYRKQQAGNLRRR